jgi:hypothetical protein
MTSVIQYGASMSWGRGGVGLLELVALYGLPGGLAPLVELHAADSPAEVGQLPGNGRAHGGEPGAAWEVSSTAAGGPGHRGHPHL